MNAINFPAYVADAMEKRDTELARKAQEAKDAEAVRKAVQALNHAAVVASRLTPCDQQHRLRAIRYACNILAKHDGGWQHNIQIADLLDACEARGLRVSRADCGREAVWARFPADLACRAVAIYALKRREGWVSTAGDCKIFICRFLSRLGWPSNIRAAEIKKLLAVPKRQNVCGRQENYPLEETVFALLATIPGAMS